MIRLQEYQEGKNVTITLRVVKGAESDAEAVEQSLVKKPRFLVEQAGAMVWDDKTKTWGWNKNITDAMAHALGAVRTYTRVIPGTSVQQKTTATIQLDYGLVRETHTPATTTVYANSLPYDFAQLAGEEKARAQEHANNIAHEYEHNMQKQNQEKYQNERAGVIASLMQKYEHMAVSLRGGIEVLIPMSTHHDTMEWILKTCLTWKDDRGIVHKGFNDMSSIGGFFAPMEYYDIRIYVDEAGNTQSYKVTFNESRPKMLEAHLDAKNVRMLAQWYEQFQKH